jgi:hypothetical protein
VTRIFLDDLRANIAAAIPDNTTGLVDPADVRVNMLDTVDSTVPDEAALTQSAPLVGVVLTAAWLIPLSLFDGTLGGDGVFLKPNAAGGFIEGTTTPGFSYYIIAETNFIAANNDVVEVSAVIDGVPFGPATTLISNGTDPLTLNIIAIQTSMPSNGQLALAYRSTAGATITINSSETLVVVTPTNNP